jgi:hypothetical protein
VLVWELFPLHGNAFSRRRDGLSFHSAGVLGGGSFGIVVCVMATSFDGGFEGVVSRAEAGTLLRGAALDISLDAT